MTEQDRTAMKGDVAALTNVRTALEIQAAFARLSAPAPDAGLVEVLEQILNIITAFGLHHEYKDLREIERITRAALAAAGKGEQS